MVLPRPRARCRWVSVRAQRARRGPPPRGPAAPASPGHPRVPGPGATGRWARRRRMVTRPVQHGINPDGTKAQVNNPQAPSGRGNADLRSLYVPDPDYRTRGFVRVVARVPPRDPGWNDMRRVSLPGPADTRRRGGAPPVAPFPGGRTAQVSCRRQPVLQPIKTARPSGRNECWRPGRRDSGRAIQR